MIPLVQASERNRRSYGCLENLMICCLLDLVLDTGFGNWGHGLLYEKIGLSLSTRLWMVGGLRCALLDFQNLQRWWANRPPPFCDELLII